MKKYTIFLLMPFLLMGCRKTNLSKNASSELQDSIAVAMADTSVTDNHAAVVEPVENNFPVDSLLPFKLLEVGTGFHEEEVFDGADAMKWYGLFKNGTAYYWQKTAISTKKVEDVVVDAKGEKTGWEVTAIDNVDPCLVLIEELPYLSDREIKSVTLQEEIVNPNDTLRFRFLDVDYQLFATGEYENNFVKNYRLFLTANVHGQAKQSLLMATRYFEDTMPRIIFAGDMDGDSILDLIIDATYHYNMSIPTVYFSRAAAKNEVVCPIASHITVGC